MHSWPCRGHWLQNKHRCQTGQQHGASAWHPLVHTTPADPTHTTYIRQITHHRTAYTLIRLAFRLAVLVYRCLHGTAPVYLSADLLRVSDISSRQRRPRHWLAVTRSVRQSATVLLPLLHRPSGTASQKTYGHPHRCSCSDVGWSLNFSGVLWAQDTPRDSYLCNVTL